MDGKPENVLTVNYNTVETVSSGKQQKKKKSFKGWECHSPRFAENSRRVQSYPIVRSGTVFKVTLPVITALL